MVGEQCLSRVATFLVNNSKLNIAQQTYEHQDGGEIEIVGMEMLNHLCRNGIHDIAYERYRACDGDSLVDEGEVVRFANDRNSVSKNVMSTSQ